MVGAEGVGERTDVVLVVGRDPDVAAQRLDRVDAAKPPGVLDHDLRSFFTSGPTHSLPLSIVATRSRGKRSNTPWQISAAIVSEIARSEVRTP